MDTRFYNSVVNWSLRLTLITVLGTLCAALVIGGGTVSWPSWNEIGALSSIYCAFFTLRVTWEASRPYRPPRP